MKSSQRKQALAAGIALLVMALLAAFSYGYILSNLEVEGDPAATFEFLTTRETRKHLSLATAIARLLYTAVLGIAIARLPWHWVRSSWHSG